MQPKSIPEPLRPSNERTETPFPTSGDNFETVLYCEPGVDIFAVLEAMSWLDDYAIALAAFEQELARTGKAPETPPEKQ